MIVYVESNFVLELALLQGEHQSCDSIVSLAESLTIDLAIPAFSLAEPYDVWRRRNGERTELYERLIQQMGHQIVNRPKIRNLTRYPVSPVYRPKVWRHLIAC